MERQELIDHLKFLFDQYMQTKERADGLHNTIAQGLQDIASLNYDNDAYNLHREYNRTIRQALEDGILSPDELNHLGLAAEIKFE